MRSCIRTIICINGQCFDNIPDAVKCLLDIASRRRPVTITRFSDTHHCLPT